MVLATYKQIGYMKKLILLRHAKSDWYSASTSDIDRPLNARGENDSKKIGKWITTHHLPEFAQISSARRTVQTFELSSIKCEYIFERSLYLADERQLLDAIRTTDKNIGALMLVGHNPGITDLANLFLNSNEGYLELKTANCAVFEFNIQSWENVNRKNGELIDFASGKKL